MLFRRHRRAREKRCVLAGERVSTFAPPSTITISHQGEQVNNPIREKVVRFLAEQGSDALWRALQQCDAASAAIIHPPQFKTRVARS